MLSYYNVKSSSKNYDFSYKNVNKIEYKGIYYKYNDKTKTANNGSLSINKVMIGKDKIIFLL
jgi:hypothetical protein